MATISTRILDCLDALPLTPGMRVLEVGCGPGVAARELVRRGHHVVAIDRSPTAIELAERGSARELESGRLEYRVSAAEDFVREPEDAPFDLAFALRVGALDGRHPAAGRLAIDRIRAALAPTGRLFIDGGSPLREVPL